MDSIKLFRAGILLILVAASLILIGTSVYLKDDLPGLLLSLGTNLLSTALTYYLIERLIGAREKQEGEKQEKSKLKRKLLGRMASDVNSVAIAAVEELRQLGWLYDGTLRGVDFMGANLQGADLSKADLRDTNFSDANLQGANLIAADLQGAHLHGINLKKALLEEANLQRAGLVSGNLQQAEMREANLQESELLLADLSSAKLSLANLSGADLSGANIVGTEFRGANLNKAKVRDIRADETTVLPDGTKWSETTGITTLQLAGKNKSISEKSIKE
jgi:hypothetical protein